MKVAYEGECMVVPCPFNIDPVCSNGKTYDNSCLAVAEFVIHKGECKSDPEAVTFTESTTSSTGSTTSAPTISPAPTTQAPTVPPFDSEPIGKLSDSAPSSASAAVIGTSTVLAVSAFIFVAV